MLLVQLAETGHEVVALVRAAQKANALGAIGAKVAQDALNLEELAAASTGTS